MFVFPSTRLNLKQISRQKSDENEETRCDKKMSFLEFSDHSFLRWRKIINYDSPVTSHIALRAKTNSRDEARALEFDVLSVRLTLKRWLTFLTLCWKSER